MADVYEIAMRLAVEDQATAALVSIGRELARLGDAAMEAADKFEALGLKAAATAESIKGIALLGGAGALAIGGGILGGLALITNATEKFHEQISKLNMAGWEQRDVMLAQQEALSRTAMGPMTGPAKNLEVIGQLMQLTGDPAAARQLAPGVARFNALMGDRATESLMMMAQQLGLQTPEQRERFERLQEQMFKTYAATGTSPEAIARQTLLSRGRAGYFEESFFPILGALTPAGGGGGGFAATRASAGAALSTSLSRLTTLPEEITKAKPPLWVETLKELYGAAGMSRGGLRQATTNPYEFMQQSLGPALFARYGNDMNRAADALTKIFGPAGAAPWITMYEQGRFSRERRGLAGESPLESAARRSLAAMSTEEAVKYLMATDPEAIRRAIAAEWERIENVFREKSISIRTMFEQRLLGGLQFIEDWLLRQDPEVINRWVTGLASLGAILSSAGLTVLLGRLAFTPLGGLTLLLTALGSFVERVAAHPEVGRAFEELSNKGLTEETARTLASAFWAAFKDEWAKEEQAMAGQAAWFNKMLHSVLDPVWSETVKDVETNLKALYEAIRSWASNLPLIGGLFTKPTEAPKEPSPLIPGGPPITGTQPAPPSSVLDMFRGTDQLSKDHLARAAGIVAAEAERQRMLSSIPGLGRAGPGGAVTVPGTGAAPTGGAVGVPGVSAAPPPGVSDVLRSMLIPLSMRPGDSPGRGGLEDAVRNAVWTAPQKDARPVVISLNLDGQRVSEILSTQLAANMEHPGQAPFHDGWRGWQSPDMQWSTT